MVQLRHNKILFSTSCKCVDIVLLSFLTAVAISLIIGLISFSPSLKQTDDGVVVSPGWSYGVGWLSMVLSSACALYFVSVGWYRFRKPTPSHFPSESRSYAPLAQFESTDTGSDDNYDGD